MDHQLTLDGNHLSIEQVAGGHVLRIAGADGAQAVEIALTPSGPVLRIAAGMRIEVAGDLAIEAENLQLRGRDSVRIEAGRGDVAVRANDDVLLDGERIRMNC